MREIDRERERERSEQFVVECWILKSNHYSDHYSELIIPNRILNIILNYSQMRILSADGRAKREKEVLFQFAISFASVAQLIL